MFLFLISLFFPSSGIAHKCSPERSQEVSAQSVCITTTKVTLLLCSLIWENDRLFLTSFSGDMKEGIDYQGLLGFVLFCFFLILFALIPFFFSINIQVFATHGCSVINKNQRILLI